MNDTGRRAYEAYCAAVGGQTIDSKPMPPWAALDAPRQAGWAAAEATPQIKRWWRSKTLWLNALGFVLTCTAAAEMALPALNGLFDGSRLFLGISFLLPIANAALRFLTQTAVGK